MIIGIDHGYGFIKTKHAVFAAGLAKFSDEPAFTKRLVEVDGSFYQVGCMPDGIAGDKTESEDYYIMTLAAIAEEMKAAGTTGAYVTLAIGVPLTRYGKERNALEAYLGKNSKVTFKYEGVEYKIFGIQHIYTYPQGYAAIASRLGTIHGACNLIDIGTGTTDISPILSDKTVDLSKARTLQLGISNCLSMVNEAVSREYQTEIPNDVIVDLMIGNDIVLPRPVISLIEDTISEWCEMLLKTLRQNKINYVFTQTFFAGGGALLISKYAKNLDKENSCITFITDIKANAIGYEMLAAVQVEKNKRKDTTGR